MRTSILARADHDTIRTYATRRIKESQIVSGTFLNRYRAASLEADDVSELIPGPFALNDLQHIQKSMQASVDPRTYAAANLIPHASSLNFHSVSAGSYTHTPISSQFSHGRGRSTYRSNVELGQGVSEDLTVREEGAGA